MLVDILLRVEMFCAQMRGEIRFTWHVACSFRFFACVAGGLLGRKTVQVGVVRRYAYKVRNRVFGGYWMLVF